MDKVFDVLWAIGWIELFVIIICVVLSIREFISDAKKAGR